MAMLSEPMELLDLEDMKKLTFRVVRFEQGETAIKTQDEPGGKVVAVLRVHVPRELKPIGMPYYDVTSKTLQAQLLPFLQDPTQRGRTFTITAHGIRPRKRFELAVTG